jgi:outer membrane protein assembly factor BamB
MSRTLLLSASLLVAHGILAATASTHPWPQFRGPQGDGVSAATGVPLSWNATSNVAWKIEVPGRGWSSPVLAHGRIYLTSALPSGGSNQVSLVALAFDAASGKPAWQTTIFPPSTNALPVHAKNSHASPTPLVDGDRIYVHFGPRGSACLDLDGRVQWTNTSLVFDPKHGNGGSPILVNGRLIFTCDGTEDPFIAALNASTGELAWRTPRQAITTRKFSFGTPTAITVDGSIQVISPASGCAAAYDPVDGREIWRIRHDGYSVIPKPVFGHGLVYLGTGFNTPIALAIRPNGTGDVTESHTAWSLKRGAGQTPSFLLDGDELFMLSDNGILTCANAKTGEIYYQERACGQSSSSPILADGRIYLLDEQGLGVVVARGREFKKLSENPIGERALASYAVTDGSLFIRSESHLYSIRSQP